MKKERCYKPVCGSTECMSFCACSHKGSQTTWLNVLRSRGMVFTMPYQLALSILSMSDKARDLITSVRA